MVTIPTTHTNVIHLTYFESLSGIILCGIAIAFIPSEIISESHRC
jgi:hypothetical protein